MLPATVRMLPAMLLKLPATLRMLPTILVVKDVHLSKPTLRMFT